MKFVELFWAGVWVCEYHSSDTALLTDVARL